MYRLVVLIIALICCHSVFSQNACLTAGPVGDPCINNTSATLDLCTGNLTITFFVEQDYDAIENKGGDNCGTVDRVDWMKVSVLTGSQTIDVFAMMDNQNASDARYNPYVVDMGAFGTPITNIRSSVSGYCGAYKATHLSGRSSFAYGASRDKQATITVRDFYGFFDNSTLQVKFQGEWDEYGGGGENIDLTIDVSQVNSNTNNMDPPTVSDDECDQITVSWANVPGANNCSGQRYFDVQRKIGSGAWATPSNGSNLPYSQLSYTDTDAAILTSSLIQYRVRNLYSGNSSAWRYYSQYTSGIAGEIGPNPESPVITNITSDDCSDVLVTWNYDASGGAHQSPKEFILMRKTTSEPTYSDIATGLTTSSSPYSDNTAVAGVTYQYQIRVVNQCDDEATSAPSMGSVPGAPLAATEITVTIVDDKIQLNWTDNATDETSYKIERTSAQGLDVFDLNANTSSYLDNAITPCRTYTYTIKTISKCYPNGTASMRLDTLIPIDLSTAFATDGTGFTASKGYFTNKVELAWNNTAINQTNTVKIFRRVLDSGDPFTLLTTLSSSSGLYNDLFAEAGELYEYRIIAEGPCENATIQSNSINTIGFRLKSGQVSGNVAYIGDNAVEGVKIVAESTTVGVGSSINIAGGSISIPYNSNQNLIDELLVESWLMPEAYSASFNIISKTSDYKLHYDHSSTSYKFDVYNGASTLSLSVHRDSLPIGDWNYIGGQINNDKMQLIVGGRVVDSSSVSGIAFSNTVNEGVSLYDGMIGKATQLRIWKTFKDSLSIAQDYSRYMNGNESNLLVFYPMNEKVGNYVYDRSKVSSSNYNKNHGLLTGVETWSSNVPTRNQLSFAAYTDNQGDYILTLPYTNAGENYRLTPIFETHEFDPKNKLLFIGDGSTVINGVNFLDKSSFEMTGTLFYDGTTCPVKDAFFEIDGRPVNNDVGGLVKTDVNGDYSIQVPIGKHYIVVKKSNHTFSSGRWPVEEGSLFNFQEPLPNVPFKDNTKIILVGRAVGGTVEEKKIPGLGRSKNNIGVTKITLRNTKDCGWITDSINNVYRRDTTFTTDPNSGEYKLALFPFQYAVSRVELLGDPTAIDFGAFPPIDLRQEVELGVIQSVTTEVDTVFIPKTTSISRIDSITYNKEANFIYRSDPDFDITTKIGEDFIGEEEVIFQHTKYPSDTLNLKTNPMLFPVFVQNKRYDGIISVFEPYKNIDNDSMYRVPVTKGSLEIDNRLAVNPNMVIDLEANDTLQGMIPYSFYAGDPNLLSNQVDIPYSFTKTFQIALDDGVRDPKPTWEPFDYAAALPNTPSNEKYFRGFIFGDRAIDGTNFVTQGPSLVRYILRDPPGGESFATLSEGMSVSTTHTWGVNLGADGIINYATKGGIKTLTGLGFIAQNEVKADNIQELSFGTTLSTSGEYVRTVTSSDTYTTSANANNVGAGSDLFMGQSSNYNFGISQQFGFFPDNVCISNATVECFGDSNNGFRIGRTKRMYVAPDGIETTFFLTQKDIENYEIPNLINLRNDKLSNDANYNSILTPADPRYGSNNDDPIFGGLATGNSLSQNNPPSYTFDLTDSIDQIRVFNEQIRLWEEALALNEQDKIEAEFVQNFSFDGGGSSFERTYTTEESDTYTWSFEARFSQKNKTAFGVELNGNGIEVENSISFQERIGYGGSKAVTNTKTTGYTITDPDIWDRLSIDVNESRRGFGPVFKINAGETSCPHEGELKTKYYQPNGVPIVIAPGTLQLEQPSLAVDVNKIVNVPDDEAAEFVFRLGNNSTQGWGYGLSLLNHTNPGGAIIVNSGTSELGTSPFVIAAGDETQQRILIERGGAYKHDSLLFVFHSTCQYDQGNDFDVDIGDSVYISAHFIPTCTDIEIFRPDDFWVLNKSFDDKMEIIISDYNVNTPNFDNFELQYKPSNEAQWNLLQKFYKDTSGITGTNFSEISSSLTSTKYNWDVLPLSDGEYDLRVTADCQIAESESYIHTGYIDRKSIEVFGTPSPADGILDPNDDILLTMNETIDEGGITSLNMDVRGVLNGTDLRHETSLGFDGVDDYATIVEYQLQQRSMTIEFWLKRNATGPEMILSQGSSVADQLAISFTGSNNIQFQVGDRAITSMNAITDEEWHHYALVYDRANLTAEIIIDYVLDNTINSFGTNYNSSGEILIAKHQSGAVPMFEGFIHELRFWSIPRTVAEIASNGLFSLSGRESGLIGNWPMQEAWGSIAFDKVRSRHARLAGTTWSILPSNHSFSFDGNTDYLEALSAGSLGLDVESDITIEAWFKTNESVSQSILSNGKADGSRPEDFAWNVYINSNGAVVLENDGNTLLTPAGFNDNNWHHFSAVVERTKSVSIYIDGELVTTGNASNYKGFVGPKIWVGCRGWYEGPTEMRDFYFDGSLDDIRIWNIARKPEQIKRDFVHQMNGDEIGLQAYYPFDGVKEVLNQLLREPNLIDASSNNYNLTVGAGAAEQYNIDAPPVKLPRLVQSVNFTYSINDDQVYIEITDPPARVENVTLDITVRGLKDLAGNFMESPETWIAYIDKNQVFWETEYFQFEKKLEDDLSFKAKIKNTGGSQESYNLSNLPSWLSASPSSGLIDPNSIVEVTFRVQSLLNIGEYEQDIYVSTESFGFNERLLLDLKVTVDPPEWVVAPASFSHSMSIVGQFEINDVISTDPEDLVSVWVNDELRGVTHVEYDPSSGKHLVFLDVYSNVTTGEVLEFRAWDASRGRLLKGLIPDDIGFIGGGIIGSRGNPIPIEATVLTQLQYVLTPGWNWISFPLASTVLGDINQALVELSPTENDQMKYPGKEHTYSGGSWRGEEALTTNRGYKIRVAKADTFRYEGTFIDPSTEPINIVDGWNWIGVKSEFIIDVPSAMASLDPETGDVIKGQRSFAIYEDGFGWGGSLDFLQPKQGYMLKYHTSDQLIYPSNLNARTRPETQLKSRSQRGKEYAQLEKSLNYVEGKYSNTMSLIAEIDACITLNSGDVELDLSQWSLVAHAGDECRGVVESTWQSSTGKYVYYLSIEGSSNVDLQFQLVHNTNGSMISLSQTMSFTSNGVVGMNSMPYQFTCIADDCIESSLFQSGDIDMSQSEMTQHVMTDLRSDALLPSDRIYRFKAGNSIELILGFEVMDGATLEAYIEDCITTKK